MLHTIDGGKTHQVREGRCRTATTTTSGSIRANPKRMIAANDGGVHISRNGGETWFTPPLPISQFYHVAADTRRPVLGRRRDAGSRHGAGTERQPHRAAST